MNIGLVAMSGIRVCDAELLRLGLTLPGFVERSKTIASLPSLGLLTLAGMTPRHHVLRYLEMPAWKDTMPAPEGFDLVAISSYSAQIREAYALADRLRAAGVRVVIGGPHVTALPEEAAAHADAVVVGEGEAVWPSLLEDAERGELRSRYGSRDSGFDLADAPMPAFELLDLPRYNRLTLQTSRGCPHHCEFCAASVLLTPRYKQKPAARVRAELDRICDLWAHPFIEFADDNSFVHPAYWKELLPYFSGKGLRWFAETDISVAEDAELLELMRESGCTQILIGLESPTPSGLAGMELRSDWKRRRGAQYREAIREIQNHGITVNGCFVLGLDGQTADAFAEVAAFVKESELYEVQVTILTPFPGTPLHDRLKHEGRLLDPGNWDRCTLFDLNFRPDRMTGDELTRGFKRLVVDLYSEECTQARRRLFKQRMREAKRKGGVE